MQDIIAAIWVQDFDALLEINSFHLLLLLLTIVLWFESSFVFLPLPGDGLVLFVGGLVGIGVIPFFTALVALSIAASLGSLVAYVQGRLLQGARFMIKAEQALPDGVLDRAGSLLARYGFLSLFVSRFIPFVRVLTPMLMGLSKLSVVRTVAISFSSSLIWVISLLLAGKWVMRHPLLTDHQELIAKWFLIGSLGLMVCAFITLFLRLWKKNQSPANLPSKNSPDGEVS
ncbi:DedA family protein [Vibrio mexicanus]|uniref:DedA family protein n=1 Tax=Vibrio mexicanus TaxID=1004326 RepID=UPI00063CE030|nr:DedA family protein [Vibrio mexicanus]